MKIELTDKITLYNADNMDIMPLFEDKHFDLAIIDPPYGISCDKMQMGSAPNRKGKNQYPGESTAVKLKRCELSHRRGKLKDRILNTMDCSWDKEPPTVEFFNELFRISKNQIIWGGNYFPLPPTRGIICWDKMQPWDNFSQFELAWTSFNKPAAMFRLSNTGGANKETKIHPTQKPVKLYEFLLNRYAKPDFIILDTHIGSGSSAIAAYRGGFEYVGIEKDLKYFNSACKRIKNEIQQTRMFL